MIKTGVSRSPHVTRGLLVLHVVYENTVHIIHKKAINTDDNDLFWRYADMLWVSLGKRA